MIDDATTEHGNGSSRTIQLWQFLLRLLVDGQSLHLIRWVGSQGEFEFVDPDGVAAKWAQVKGCKNASFANVTRALRSYYASGFIGKVDSHQYRYKFQFDPTVYVGYSFEELNRLVHSTIQN